MSWLHLPNRLVMANGLAPNVRAPLTPEARRAIVHRPTPAAWEALGALRTGSALNLVQEALFQVSRSPAECAEMAGRVAHEVLRQRLYSLRVQKDDYSGEVEVISVGLPSGTVFSFHVSSIRAGLPRVTKWREGLPTSLVQVLEREDIVRVSSCPSTVPALHQIDSDVISDRVLELRDMWAFEPRIRLLSPNDVAGALQGCSITPVGAHDADYARRFDTAYGHAKAAPEHQDVDFIKQWVADLRANNVQARVQRRYLYASTQAPLMLLFAHAIHSYVNGDAAYGEGDRVSVARKMAAKFIQTRAARIFTEVPPVGLYHVAIPLPLHLFHSRELPLDLRRLPRYPGECEYCGHIFGYPFPFRGELRGHTWETCPHRRQRAAAIRQGHRHAGEPECGYTFCNPNQRKHEPSGCQGARMLCPLCGLRGHPFGMGCGRYTREELIAMHQVILPLLHPHYRNSRAWEAESYNRTPRHLLHFVRGETKAMWVEPALAAAASELLSGAEIDVLIAGRTYGTYEETMDFFGGF